MSDSIYRYDPRLESARTPPACWYTDPRVLEEEHRKVFARTWQLAGRAAQVAEAGQYFTATVADEPLVVVRGLDERLRAFSNVCRHRAGPIACGAGRRRSFQCGYHGWTYALDGRLLVTPEFDGVEDWSREEHGLPEFRVEEWGALVFVNLDAAAAPLAATLAGISAQAGGPEHWSGMQLAARKDWYVECNWKTYVDNYLEGYHIPVVHPSLNRELDYARYRTETRRFYSIQHAPIKRTPDARLAATGAVEGAHRDDRNGGGGDHTSGDDEGGGGGGAGPEAQYFWVFPNLMINVYPDNYSTNLIVPLAAERTLTIFEWYFRDHLSAEGQAAVRRTVEFSDEIQREDISICETVQRGLRSRTYTEGRYSVARENGVHHFHGLLAEFLDRS